MYNYIPFRASSSFKISATDRSIYAASFLCRETTNRAPRQIYMSLKSILINVHFSPVARHFPSTNRIKSGITRHFGFETTFRFPSNWKQAYLVLERINFNGLNIQARLGFFSIDRIPVLLLHSCVKVNPDEISKV